MPSVNHRLAGDTFDIVDSQQISLAGLEPGGIGAFVLVDVTSDVVPLMFC